MYENKGELRATAHAALAQRGYAITEEKYAGARLTVLKNGRSSAVAVRTSSNRWVGWMRTETGEWRAMAGADLIIVAAFDNESRPKKIEVYAFKPEDVLTVFTKRLASRQAKNPGMSTRAPVFVCLDRYKDKDSPDRNLKAKALWIVEIPLGKTTSEEFEAANDQDTGLTIAMAKQGLAKTYGVSPESIEIIIRG